MTNKIPATIEEMRECYSTVYQAKGSNYCVNMNDPRKYDYVLDYVRRATGRVLDAGCGCGEDLKPLRDTGLDVYGIEFTKYCVEEILYGYPCECDDIVSHSKKGNKYAGIICMGVLEHLPPNLVDETIGALRTMSDSLLCSIANHPDEQCGYVLHVIQETKDWWLPKLEIHFPHCQLVYEKKNLFIFECKGE